MRLTQQIESTEQADSYEIVVAANVLDDCGLWARECLGAGVAKIAIISNPTVFDLYGSAVENSLADAGFSVSYFLMGDGEDFKNLRSAEAALRYLASKGISRTDAVVALGGGVVGDLAGFAAAIHLRGIQFLQIPTTLLAMIDSSVGGKTGVNTAVGKNMIGCFHQPKGVLIDIATLATLAKRELAAGFCEMIKHGALSGHTLLGHTQEFLTAFPLSSLADSIDDPIREENLSHLISENVAFKGKIVAGDEQESSERTDPKSRKILNLGHTLAHALENVTSYKYFKHGEAVGWGVLFAAELSKTLALCDETVVKSLNDVVHRLGTLPTLAGIDEETVFAAFKFDKKNIAGSLQMVLLRDIGQPAIVDSTEIPSDAMRAAYHQLQRFEFKS